MGMKSMTMFVVLTVMILLTSGSVVRTEVEQAHNDSVNDLDRYTFTIYRGVQKIFYIVYKKFLTESLKPILCTKSSFEFVF